MSDYAAYGWIIDKDHLYNPNSGFEERNDTGTMGPRRISPEIKAQLKAGKGEKFRMLDDDGELYYTGRIIGPADGSPEAASDECIEWEFAPLSGFGARNAGCTDIQYKNDKGEWKNL
ncbi:hypothetical protein AB0G15_05775 [Streptosporangium sp. NPDC023825]|uniref:hypothetical protein n=1 Tax=Streptosporangium sp. NPDC023825 TaxID=3154909 RepID=UPI0034376FB8